MKKLRGVMMDNQKFEYMLLSRLQMDCKSCIQSGSIRHLWGIDVESHIAKMRELMGILKVKPEWLSIEEINQYEKDLRNTAKLEQENDS